jgi:hypothetical protein
VPADQNSEKFVTIEIADTGMGMDPNVQSPDFHLFARRMTISPGIHTGFNRRYH